MTHRPSRRRCLIPAGIRSRTWDRNLRLVRAFTIPAGFVAASGTTWNVALPKCLVGLHQPEVVGIGLERTDTRFLNRVAKRQDIRSVQRLANRRVALIIIGSDFDRTWH